jgi:hypothetical protein
MSGGLAKNFLMLDATTSTARSNLNAERSALVADVLRHNSHSRQVVRLRVHGESMLPTLWPGDVVEIESCSLEDVRPGEIVLARREGRLILHRLIAPCTPNGFLLRGDSMPSPDPPFPPETLLGRIAGRCDEGRTVYGAGLGPVVRANGFGVKWSRALGMLLCYCVMARRVALKLHNRRKASWSERRSPEPRADISSADMGA